MREIQGLYTTNNYRILTLKVLPYISLDVEIVRSCSRVAGLLFDDQSLSKVWEFGNLATPEYYPVLLMRSGILRKGLLAHWYSYEYV